jgi:hypothetical protein
MLCDYGCGTEATTQLKNKKWCCGKGSSSCPTSKEKNRSGLIRAHAEGRAGYSYEDLPDETKNRMNWNKDNYSNVVFDLNGPGNHKAALLQERGHRCEDCGLSEWKDQPIPIELEHTDGNNENHSKENLKLLCCNCHALTPTWRGRNKNFGITKVSDAELLTALQESSNIRQALQKVGLAAKGGNYTRATKLMKMRE